MTDQILMTIFNRLLILFVFLAFGQQNAAGQTLFAVTADPTNRSLFLITRTLPLRTKEIEEFHRADKQS